MTTSPQPDGIRLSANISIPASELVESFQTSGGPGGQHANRSNTAVELAWDIAASTAIPDDLRARLLDRLGRRADSGTLRVTAADSRSQWRNRALARARMTELLQDAMRPQRRRRATRPTTASRKRRIRAKRRRGETKKLRRRPELED